jgi:hypothetical protein
MPVMMLGMMFTSTGSFKSRAELDLCTRCVLMVQAATKGQVHGDSQQEANAECAVHDCSQSKSTNKKNHKAKDPHRTPLSEGKLFRRVCFVSSGGSREVERILGFFNGWQP